jgi:hypothetical protein
VSEVVGWVRLPHTVSSLLRIQRNQFGHYLFVRYFNDEHSNSNSEVEHAHAAIPMQHMAMRMVWAATQTFTYHQHQIVLQSSLVDPL